jgi:hypothetical protein
MNKKLLSIAIALVILAIVVAPVSAKLPSKCPLPPGTPYTKIWELLQDLQNQISGTNGILSRLAALEGSSKVKNIWISPLSAYASGPNGPPTKLINAGICDASNTGCTPSALQITSTKAVTEDDSQWVFFPLTVPDGAKIKGVKYYYSIKQKTASTTYISQTRLTQMTTPNQALVMMDDADNLYGPGPADHTSVASYTANGANTLNLRVVINDPSDSIIIGGIEIFVEK